MRTHSARPVIDQSTVARLVEVEGFCVLPRLLSCDDVDEVLSALAEAGVATTRSRGVRNLASKVPAVRLLAESRSVRSIAESVLGSSPLLVRSILFDKVEGANWNMRWHQDVTVAVQRRIEAEGYGPWSVKEGVESVQAPAAVLERMISVRVHLDDCGPDNGALRVIPRSHCVGKLGASQRAHRISDGPERLCSTQAGGALVMRPLLLHASSPSTSPTHRRVVHLDYAVGPLGAGLEWSQRS